MLSSDGDISGGEWYLRHSASAFLCERLLKLLDRSSLYSGLIAPHELQYLRKPTSDSTCKLLVYVSSSNTDKRIVK